MASISKRIVNGETRFDVRYRDPESKQRTKTFRRMTDARAFASICEADKLRGTYIDADAGRETFKVAALAWLKTRGYSSNDLASAEARLRNHVFPTIGSMQLRQIKPSTLNGLMAKLDKLSDNYAHLIFGSVNAVLAAAVDDNKIAKNPAAAKSVRRPSKTRSKIKPWEPTTLFAVRDALPERYRILATLGAGLGLRQGELFGLAVEDVDFLRGVVHVRRQVIVFANNRLVFSPPKYDKEREVPLPTHVRDELAAYLAKYPATRVELPWEELDGEPMSARLIVTTRERGALNKNYINRLWKTALGAAKLDATARVNMMHMLRHTYASTLLDAGESILAIAENLGHADPGFTLRTYTHLMSSHDERTRAAIDAMFRSEGDIDVSDAAAELISNASPQQLAKVVELLRATA